MKVCSYAFFRHGASAYEHPNAGDSQGKFFVNFLRVLVRAHHACFPGWELRIHHDDRVQEMAYFKALQRMRDAGLLRLVDMGQAQTLCGSMLWRMIPAFEEGVEVVVCRDVDSLPMPHDRRAIEEWLATGKAVHLMHGSESHSGIMGGTISVRTKEFQKLVGPIGWERFVTQLGAAADLRTHGGDQRALNGSYRGILEPSMLIHKLKRTTMCSEGAAEVRTIIAQATPDDIHPDVAIHGDSFANFVGACYDVEPPYAFYRGLARYGFTTVGEMMVRIQKCEEA